MHEEGRSSAVRRVRPPNSPTSMKQPNTKRQWSSCHPKSARQPKPRPLPGCYCTQKRRTHHSPKLNSLTYWRESPKRQMAITGSEETLQRQPHPMTAARRELAPASAKPTQKRGRKKRKRVRRGAMHTMRAQQPTPYDGVEPTPQQHTTHHNCLPQCRQKQYQRCHPKVCTTTQAQRAPPDVGLQPARRG